MAPKQDSTESAAPDLTDLIKRDGQKLRTILRNRKFGELEKRGIVTETGFAHCEVVEGLTPVLLSAAEDADVKVRSNAIYLLSELGPVDAGPLFLRLAQSDDKDSRVAAAAGLRKLERCGPELVKPFLELFRNPDHAVRGYAAEALFRLESVDDVESSDLVAALAVLPDGDTDVAETVGWLLARNGRVRVAELVQCLSRSEFAVRLAALKALYLLDMDAARVGDGARALAGDKVPAIRAWAVLLAARADAAGLEAWVPKLTEIVTGGHSNEISLLALTLLARAGEHAADSLPAILGKRRTLGGFPDELPIHEFGAAAVPHIRAALAANQISLHDALTWLGKLGDTEALSLAGADIRRAADNLGWFGEAGLQRARVVLEDQAQDALHPAVIQGLRHAGDGAVSLLRAQLTKGNGLAKTVAARVAAQNELRVLAPELKALLTDAHRQAPIASACALVRFGEDGEAKQVLAREWERKPGFVAVEIVKARVLAMEFLPLALQELANPEECGVVIGVIEFLGAHAEEGERNHAIDALRRVCGKWSSLRYEALRAAERLRRPDIQEPFPTLRQGSYPP